jgi:hypothetical protein
MKKVCLFILFWSVFLTPFLSADVRTEIPVSVKQLRAHVQELVKIQPPRNYRHVASLDLAAEYIFKQFQLYGNRVEFQEYKVADKKYKNVIASFGPRSGERIIVGAHYDVCGEVPGADDNATGVASILELARLFSVLKPRLKHRIDLVAYSLEEPPFFRTQNMGSAVHAKSLAKDGVKIRVMISLDMIGYFSEAAAPLEMTSSFAKPGAVVPGLSTTLIGKKEDEELSCTIHKFMTAVSGRLAVVALNPPRDTAGVDWSDHLNFWNHGYPAMMITNFFVCPNPHYHRPADKIDLLDFDKIALIVRGVYNAVVKF